jgi:hypothetical protein
MGTAQGEMSLVIQEDASPSSVKVLATNKSRKLWFLAIDLCTSVSAERWSNLSGIDAEGPGLLFSRAPRFLPQNCSDASQNSQNSGN